LRLRTPLCRREYCRQLTSLFSYIPLSREQHGFEVKNSSVLVEYLISTLTFFLSHREQHILILVFTQGVSFMGVLLQMCPKVTYLTRTPIPVNTISTEFFGYTSKFYVLCTYKKIVPFCNEHPHPNMVGIQTLTKSLGNLLNKSPYSISFCLCLHS
jgi:hypothetical protein